MVKRGQGEGKTGPFGPPRSEAYRRGWGRETASVLGGDAAKERWWMGWEGITGPLKRTLRDYSDVRRSRFSSGRTIAT